MSNKKVTAALLATGMMLTGCVSTGHVAVQKTQLMHHRFLLESVNGKPVAEGAKPLELRFGENMQISGNMCNLFNGAASLSDGELKAKGLMMTRMLCPEPPLNQLDSVLSTMLSEGAQVDLTGNQLTLATASNTLVYKLADGN